MAVTAETQTTQSLEYYTFVDDDPLMASARMQERLRAERLLEERRVAHEQNPRSLSVPLPIDALSTAHSVHEVARRHEGTDNVMYEERLAGLVLDCERLVGEWYRKKKPEYFKPIRHNFDRMTEEFFSHGLSIRQMTENALTPFQADPEEERRRINERVEDATPHIVRKIGSVALGGKATRIRTISECTDKAISDYAEDMQNNLQHRGYNGYVPEIQKVMIRDIWLDDRTDDRFQEQIGLPGKYITHDIFQEALGRRGLAADDLDKTQLHGSQILAKDDLMDFVKLLDEVASEGWCTNIFMGEEVPDGYVKDYAGFRQEALRRQEGLKDISHKVVNYVLDLAASNDIDPREAPGKVEAFVKKMLLDLAKQDVVAAEQMFDTKTAMGLQEVVKLEAAGRYDEAFARMQEVEKTAPGGGFCGAGSCGLESVNLSGKGGEDLKQKLKADDGDTIVADKERSCKCGKKGIVYAYNKAKVNKYCTSCGSFESKVSRVT